MGYALFFTRGSYNIEKGYREAMPGENRPYGHMGHDKSTLLHFPVFNYQQEITGHAFTPLSVLRKSYGDIVMDRTGVHWTSFHRFIKLRRRIISLNRDRV
jgi:hypothetical protein